MKEYIASLEKEFSLIENGFKEEEKEPLPITNLMIMSIVKIAFLAYKSMYTKLKILRCISFCGYLSEQDDILALQR